jgi:ABC-type polysaccharide/polyol phosphate export permease
MSKELAQIILLNPVALLMELAHQTVLYGNIPSLDDIIYAIITTIIIFSIGMWVFHKKENEMAERL